MKKAFRTIMLAFAAVALASACASAVRIKDITTVRGTRDNQLVGYGLVVGLNKTGDGVKMTKQTVANMLDKLGIKAGAGDINVDNVAAVLVTATFPAFAKPGDALDVIVSTVGDADSIQGGTLIMTPLKGADDRVYAVAQGPVSLGSWSAKSGGGQSKKGHPTVGRVPGGAIVERDIPTDIVTPNDRLYLSLNNPDFTTAANVAEKINKRFGGGTSKALDASTIEIKVPEKSLNNIVPFISDVETLEVQQDLVSKVVVNERTGTIVMGGDIAITPVAIAHGTLTVTVKPQFQINQPGTPFAGGQTVVIQNQEQDVEEKKVSFTRVSTSDVVDALNTMGVTPSDIIAILQALKASGSLQAELVIM